MRFCLSPPNYAVTLKFQPRNKVLKMNKETFISKEGIRPEKAIG